MAKRKSAASARLTQAELSSLDSLIKDLEVPGGGGIQPGIWWTAMIREMLRQMFRQRLITDRIWDRLRVIQGDPPPFSKLKQRQLDEFEKRLEQMSRMPTLQELKDLRKQARSK